MNQTAFLIRSSTYETNVTDFQWKIPLMVQNYTAVTSGGFVNKIGACISTFCPITEFIIFVISCDGMDLDGCYKWQHHR